LQENIICEFCDLETREFQKGFSVCPKCRNIYNKNYKTIIYEDNYFESEYKKQYGKSYIDDKIAIQNKMRFRLNKIKSNVTALHGKKLLEAGSAAGFFLEIASAAGCIATGWEVSSYMAEYANRNGNKTIQGNFLDMLDMEKNNQYDIISAFYVIEHFREQKKIWSGFSRLLRNNGLLLLAIPSYYGPAFYFQREGWLKNHPVDHFIDYSPAGLKKVCSMFGFKLVNIFPEGVHPERFFLGNIALLKHVYIGIQKIFKFSDTIFVLLKKTGNI